MKFLFGMASRTREKLIDVARSLFMRNGVENTTISDIANASDKGRRTIYTYFKNKKEIYVAVIERESDNLVKALREIAESDCAPDEKLHEFFALRLSQSMSQSAVSSSLWSLLKFDFHRNAMIRKKANEKEETLLFHILDEGVSEGVFDPARCAMMRQFILRLFQNIDTLSVQDDFQPENTKALDSFVDFLVAGTLSSNWQPQATVLGVFPPSV